MTYQETLTYLREEGIGESDLIRMALNAIPLSMISLIDWMRFTRYGEAHERDRAALRACVEFIDAHRRCCEAWGVELSENIVLGEARRLL